MVVKVSKTPSYYSRYQVKYRRRREGRTDYQARRNIIRQELCKYNTPKYRFVVRCTNKKIICQVAYATISGDRILGAAESTELVHHGMSVGLTNYAAAYATGLLCARRVLKTLGLDSNCTGKVVADGAEFHIEDEELDRAPFKCNLDIGLVHTSTGNRVFGAMKGAVDGGLHIPHSTKRFPGYVKGEEGGEDSYDAEAHRQRIFGVHVANYMKVLAAEDPEKYESHFSQYIKAGLNADNLETTYQSVHKSIRANPDRRENKAATCTTKAVRDGHYMKTVGKDGAEVRYWRPLKLTKEERGARVQSKLAEIARLATAALVDAN